MANTQLPYHAKKVISLSPDALIYISGQESVTTCVRCRKESRLIDDVTDVSVSISLDGANSASFSIVAPQYDPNRWSSRGQNRIKPMMEVEIYMRGRFLVNGEPRYYPVFWGIVTSATENYNDGQSGLNVDCDGILRWWELSKINVQPASFDHLTHSAKANPTVWTNIFGQTSPYDIIWHLATITTGGLLAPQGFDGRFRDESAIPSQLLDDQDTAIMKYWKNRFTQVGKAMRVFGFEGERIDPKLVPEAAKHPEDTRQSGTASPPPSREIKPIGQLGSETIESFRPFGQVSQGFDLFASEMTSKLEIATQVKNTISYEFYQDSTGEIIFKPPFYNLDVRPFLPYRIAEIDIISLDLTESETEVYTRLDVRGSMHDYFNEGADPSVQPYGFYVDLDLAQKFGIRQQTLNMNFLRTSEDCFFYAVGELDRLNKRRYAGSVTINGRPELRAGFPVYIEHLETFFYVTSISHSFTFGSSFNTTLGLEAARRLRISGKDSENPGEVLRNLVGVGSFKTARVEAAEKARTESNLADQEERTELKKPVSLEDQAAQPLPGHLAAEEQDLNAQTQGTLTNFFEIEEDPSVTRVTLFDGGKKVKLPITDSEGFELFGGFEYGRNIEVSPSGELKVRTKGSENTQDAAVGNLSVSIDRTETPGQDIRFSSQSNINRTQLSMVPRRDLATEQVEELAPSADPTLETQLKGLSKIEIEQRKSILSLEPGLKTRRTETKCLCHRDDKKIDKLLKKTKEQQQKAPKPNPTNSPENLIEEIFSRPGELTDKDLEDAGFSSDDAKRTLGSGLDPEAEEFFSREGDGFTDEEFDSIFGDD